MKSARPMRPGVVAVAVVAALAASAPAVQQNYEIRLSPNTLLERNIATKIEADNAKLAQSLAEFRAAINAQTAFDKTRHGRLMEGTYLKNPIIITEDGTTRRGWDDVLPILEGIIKNSTYLSVQGVQVSLEYLPFGKDAYKAKNPQRAEAGTPIITAEGDQIDFIVHVKTVLAYAVAGGDDPSLTIEGELLHRRICDPI